MKQQIIFWVAIGMMAIPALLSAQNEKLFVGNGFFLGRTGIVYSPVLRDGAEKYLHVPSIGDTLLSILEGEQFVLWKVKSVKRIRAKEDRDCVEGDVYRTEVRLIDPVKKFDIQIPLWRSFCNRLGHSYPTFRYRETFETLLTNNPQNALPDIELPFEDKADEAIDFPSSTGIDKKQPAFPYKVELSDTWSFGNRRFLMLHCFGETVQAMRLVEIRDGRMYLIATLPVY